MIYKKKEDFKHKVEIKEEKGSDNFTISFYSDCGKFHTWECIDEVEMTPLELLNIIRGCDE